MMDQEVVADLYSLQGSEFNIPDADLKVDSYALSHCSYN